MLDVEPGNLKNMSGGQSRGLEAARQRPPAMLITIDTEGDNGWSKPRAVSTRNSAFLRRFQSLCERYDLKPTWLTNWEMVHCPVFREFAADALSRNTAEIGMHLHAWNTPPLESLTEDDDFCQPFLIQYPERLMREKIARLTDVLEDTFGVKMVSHRSGRWAIDSIYARLLAEHGYLVDCTITPHVCWRSEPAKGFRPIVCDYTTFPDQPYWIDLEDIRRPGCSSLLEVPVTIVPGRTHWLAQAAHAVGRTSAWCRRVADRLFPQQLWFRPSRYDADELPQMLELAESRQWDYVQLMTHSSELMPGGSPRFPTARSIERLYESLERLFAAAQTRFAGMTLAEYRNRAESTQSRQRHAATSAEERGVS